MRHNISICTKDTKTLYVKENKNNIMLQSAVVCVSNVEITKLLLLAEFYSITVVNAGILLPH